LALVVLVRAFAGVPQEEQTLLLLLQHLLSVLLSVGHASCSALPLRLP